MFEVTTDSKLWRDFEKFTKARQLNPETILTELIKNFMELERDLEIDDAVSRAVQSSGYHEDDAVELVRASRQRNS